MGGPGIDVTPGTTAPQKPSGIAPGGFLRPSLPKLSQECHTVRVRGTYPPPIPLLHFVTLFCDFGAHNDLNVLKLAQAVKAAKPAWTLEISDYHLCFQT